jgi:hypothetical protein
MLFNLKFGRVQISLSQFNILKNQIESISNAKESDGFLWSDQILPLIDSGKCHFTDFSEERIVVLYVESVNSV